MRMVKCFDGVKEMPYDIWVDFCLSTEDLPNDSAAGWWVEDESSELWQWLNEHRRHVNKWLLANGAVPNEHVIIEKSW